MTGDAAAAPGGGPAPPTAPVAKDRVRRSRRRRWLFVLVALLLGGGAALAMLEVAFRVAWTPPAVMAEFQQQGLYVELPTGDAGLRPGYRGTLQLTPDEPVTTVAINSLGMRGLEPGDKRAGERRLLVVGDSMVFGYGVDHEQTFGAVLESTVRANGRSVTVGNGGISGFNSFESARRIAHLRPPFAPDAVLYCVYLGNDAIENRNRDVVVVGGQRFAGPYARLMQGSLRARWMARSRLCLWVEAWLFTNAGQWSLIEALAKAWPNPGLDGFPDPTKPGHGSLNACLFLDVIDENTAWPAGAPAVLPRAMADFRTGLEQAKVAAAGLPLHVLILPMWCHCTGPDWAAELQASGFLPTDFRRGALQARLAKLCGELGLPVLDATPWLEAAGDTRSSFVSDRGHLSPRGHAIVAEQLARALAPLWQ